MKDQESAAAGAEKTLTKARKRTRRRRLWRYLRQPDVIFVIVLFCVGLAFLASANFLTTPMKISFDLQGGSKNGQVTIRPGNYTWLAPLGLALVSSAVIAFISIAIRFVSRDQLQARFEEFFGKGALAKTQRGLIILETTRIDPPEIEGKQRFFKARTWVNARDAEGARILREEIRELDFPQPELEIVDTFQDNDKASYVISMGLGFHTATQKVLDRIPEAKGILLLAKHKHYGDVVVYDTGRADTNFNDDYDDPRVDDSSYESFYNDAAIQGKFHMSFFHPSIWNRDKWKLPESDINRLADYALIIRHVETGRKRPQVQLVLAGFTEDGTKAAGQYLATYWQYLWEQFVKDRPDGQTDFVVIVGGQARGEEWKRDILISLNLYREGSN